MFLVLLVSGWLALPHYVEYRFIEKMKQLGVETDSIEFKIEGVSRPIIRNLKLHISGITLVTESIEFENIIASYKDDIPLEMTIHGFWGEVNADFPKGMVDVNAALSELPKSPAFVMPIPVNVNFEKGVVVYENRGKQIEGKLSGLLELRDTHMNWNLNLSVQGNPLNGLGKMDWQNGVFDARGEVQLDSKISQSIWEIFDVEPLFEWSEGQFKTNYNFEGSDFKPLLGNLTGKLEDIDVKIANHELDNFSSVYHAIWMEGNTSFEFASAGDYMGLAESIFRMEGRGIYQPGPSVQLWLNELSIDSTNELAQFAFLKDSSADTPLEVVLLWDDRGLDFQVMAMDSTLNGELLDSYGGSDLDLMVIGRREGNTLTAASLDLWLKNPLYMSSAFQAEADEANFHASLNEALEPARFADLVSGYPDWLNSSLDVTGLSITDEINAVLGENILLNWHPGEGYPFQIEGNFLGVGNLAARFSPSSSSSWNEQSGVMYLSPGDVAIQYAFAGNSLAVSLNNYSLDSFDEWGRWLEDSDEMTINGLVSGDAFFIFEEEGIITDMHGRLEEGIYRKEEVALEGVSYSADILSFSPLLVKSHEPLLISSLDVAEWHGDNFQSNISLLETIHILDTRVETLGGSMEITDLFVNRESYRFSIELEVLDIDGNEILPWIPNVIGTVGGSLSGYLHFDFDLLENTLEMNRGSLRTDSENPGFLELRLLGAEEEETSDGFSVESALNNLRDMELRLSIHDPVSEEFDTQVKLNLKGLVETATVKAPVDIDYNFNVSIQDVWLMLSEDIMPWISELDELIETPTNLDGSYTK